MSVLLLSLGCSSVYARYTRPLWGPPVVDHNPALALTCRDRRLVDEPEQAASLPTCRQARFWRLRDVRDEVEVEAAVSAEGDGDLVLDVVKVGQEEVAEAVKRQAGVATRVSQVVVVPDQPRGPGRAAVEAYCREHPGCRVVHVRDDYNVVRVGWVDRHRLLGLIARPLADIDVRWYRVKPRLSAGSSRMRLARMPLQADAECHRPHQGNQAEQGEDETFEASSAMHIKPSLCFTIRLNTRLLPIQRSV